MKAMAVNYEDGNKTREADFYVSDAAELNNIIEEVKIFLQLTGTTLLSQPTMKYIRIFPLLYRIPTL